MRRLTHTLSRKNKRRYAARGKRRTGRREKYGESREKIQAEKTRARRELKEYRKRDTGRGKQEGGEKRKRKKRTDERMRKRKSGGYGKSTSVEENGRDKRSVGNGDKKQEIRKRESARIRQKRR